MNKKLKILLSSVASLVTAASCLSTLVCFADNSDDDATRPTVASAISKVGQRNDKKESAPPDSANFIADSDTENALSASLRVMNQSFLKIGNSSLTEAAKSKIAFVEDLQVSLASVTCAKVTWDADENREYEVSYSTCAPYAENITFLFPENGTCYLNSLRTDSDYEITVTPVIKEDEKILAKPKTISVHTPNPEVIQNFDYEDGWTACFAGERASGLTAMPSSGAIYGSYCDTITGTGIRRFDNGDYCCAMGTHYGYCGDRFLIELENGIQFTVRICDSKGPGDVQDEYGYGKYHWFGGVGNGKCIIEFIYHDGALPGCVRSAGSWGKWNWNGLNLCSNIRSIQKLANYDT